VSLLIVLLLEHLVARVEQASGDVQASGCHGHLLVAWHDDSGVAATVDGRVPINVSASTRGTPAVACGASSWLIAWPSEDFGVDGRRVALDGTLLEPLTIFHGAFGASEVAAAYGGSEFLVAWADGVTIRATRLTDGGAVLDAPSISVAPTGFFVAPRIVWNGSAFFVAWVEKGANPFIVAPVRLWGTRVTAEGRADAVSLPMIDSGAGTGGLQASLTTSGDRMTLAWVAQHGPQTCVDIAQVNESRAVLASPRQIRCSGDAAGEGVPVLDQGQIRWSRGELVLVWRELMPDSSSVLRATRVDVDKPPYAVISQRGWGAGLATTSDGVTVAYFAAFPYPDEATVGVFTRVVEQDPKPARQRAVRH
jgi:hypothetical protein